MAQNWNRALVTGASSGIGREMARQLAAAGTALVVVARNRERLEALAAECGGDVEVLQADLTNPADVDLVAQRIAASEDPIDLVVNNAGLGFTGDYVDVPSDRRNEMIDVNVTALCDLTEAAAMTMRSRREGTILNVSSVAGDVPGPQSATYNATKAFVTSLSESLSIELEPHGVTVSCLCPGLTRTEFQDRADYDTSDLPAVLWQSAEAVAQAGLEGAAKGKVVVVSGTKNWIASRAARSLPRGVTRWTSNKLGN